MATLTERDTLLSVVCPWCRSRVGQECTASKGRPITTLDGGCHDARWRAAFGTSAAVVTAAIVRAEGVDPWKLLDVGPKQTHVREPVLVGASMSEDGDRPW